ncbi:hypothetical protein GCM10009623_08080 [Nocardioides aestuarii]|uniref:DUF389 domain-containing protein n=1 Tax=Nocardioides aestuarii TaxID=252231 RepID=A0ABW4THL5_9ACTN
MPESGSGAVAAGPGPWRRGWLVVRSLVGFRTVAALALLASWVLLPDVRAQVLTAFGVALVALAAAEAFTASRLAPAGRPAALLRAAAPAAGAAVLLVGELDDVARLPVAAGAVLVVRGLADLLAARLVGRQCGSTGWLTGLGLAGAGVGAAGLVLTDTFGQAAVVVLGVAWLAGAPASLLLPAHPSSGRLTTAPVPGVATMPLPRRGALADGVYFEAADARSRLVRFTVLLTVATVIATYGVLGGSVAAVIGAMIVAPLMMPIQALAVAIVAGSTRQARISALVLGLGVLLVVVLSTFLASTFRDLEVALLNDQVSGRTNPALTDLAVAVAAGVAGGFALLRDDVADSLPGVAIAVSLVPPLCVSGALLAGGDVRLSAGAFLLFAVNFVAIVVSTSVVLVLGGFGSPEPGDGRPLVTWGLGFALAMVVTAVPLGLSGVETLERETVESAVRLELVDWLDSDEPVDVLDLRVEGDTVAVLIASVDRPPATASLEAAVSDAVGHAVTVEVHWLAADRLD